MIKAFLLVLEPLRTWDRIALAQRGVADIFLTYVVPLLLWTSAVEGYGMIHWGDSRGTIGVVQRFQWPDALGFQLVQWMVNLTTLFLGAKMLKTLGETFHGRHSYTQAFTVVAYGLGPFWTVHALDAFPSVNPWITYGLGMTLTLVVLYHGIPRCMLPDPPQAFGLYIMGWLLLALTAGLGRFLIFWLQQGRFPQLEQPLGDAVRFVVGWPVQ